jgi:peptide/nickel transport system ATP-binding protein
MIVQGRGLRWAISERRRLFGQSQTKQVLQGVDLHVNRGEVVGLAGPSGAGKTTIGMCLLRLLQPTAGAVTWDGTDVTHWSESRLRAQRRRFQALLQSPYAMLTPFLTVRQHLDETLRHLRDVRRPGPADWGAVVEELDLTAVLGSRPSSLSGGEARRVGLARILLCEPAFLFADEPDAGLDPPRRMALASRLRRLAGAGSGILVVTHDAPTLDRVSDRLLDLRDGVLREGTEA